MIYTEDMRAKYKLFLDSHKLGKGLGTVTMPCSLGAFNVAIFNKLTADIPDCMSKVIGYWIITVQDEMPFAMRNSQEWKDALLLAFGTGQAREDQRLKMIVDWMWDSLRAIQFAVKSDIGLAWKKMCEERTEEAVRALKTVSLVGVTTNVAIHVLDVIRYIDNTGVEREDIALWAASAVLWAIILVRHDGHEMWDIISPATLLTKLCE